MTKYSIRTEAIACGLMDVAEWLENEGWIPKHVQTIRLGAQRLRDLDDQSVRDRSGEAGETIGSPEGKSPADLSATPKATPTPPSLSNHSNDITRAGHD